MPGQYEESKHTRNKGKFAPKGQGAPGAGDKPPTRPVRVQEGNIKPQGPGQRQGGSAEAHPDDKRIPDDPRGGLDPEKLKKARQDREDVQGMMGNPGAEMHQQHHTHAHAGHEAARGAIEALESGNLEGAHHHGRALQLALKSLKEAGATEEQISGARNHLTALAHALKAQDHVGAHTAASGLKNEMFKIRHEAGQKAGLPPGGPPGPGGADPRFVASLDVLKRQGMIDPEEYQQKIQQHIQKRAGGEGSVDEPGFGTGSWGTRGASVSADDPRVKAKQPGGGDGSTPKGMSQLHHEALIAHGYKYMGEKDGEHSYEHPEGSTARNSGGITQLNNPGWSSGSYHDAQSIKLKRDLKSVHGDPDAVDRGAGGQVKPQDVVAKETDPLHGGSQGVQTKLIKSLDKGANYAHGEYETESGYPIRKGPNGWEEHVGGGWRPLKVTDEEIHHYYGETKPKYTEGKKN